MFDRSIKQPSTPEQNLVNAAMRYINRLSWMQTNSTQHIVSTYDSNPGSHLGSAANDFLLLFYNKNVDPQIRQAAEAKHRTLQKSEPIDYQSDYYKSIPKAEIYNCLDKSELYMNCWDFATLALYDAQIITKEQIENIISIVNNDRKLEFIHAMYYPGLQNYQPCSPQSLPKPGDLLFFQRKNDPRPWHAAIAINDKGDYIELLHWDVHIKNLGVTFENASKYPHFANEVYNIPLAHISRNINAFINNNKSFIQFNTNAIPFSDFQKTQYRYMSKQDNRFFIPERSDKFRNCINRILSHIRIFNTKLDEASIALANKTVAILKQSTHTLNEESAKLTADEIEILNKENWLTDILNAFPESKAFVTEKVARERTNDISL